MENIDNKLEMITNISNEILANGLADNRDQASKMAEEWLTTVIEDMAY